MTSHLITTYNRDKQLWNTLMRLSRLTYADEIVIVDDGSEDDTKQVVEHARAHFKSPIKYIFRKKDRYDVCSIPRNIGIKNCDGDTIIVSEPECLFITDVIAQFLKKSEEYPDHVISAGLVYFTNPETMVDETGITLNPEYLIEKVWDVKKFPMHKEDHFDKDGNKVIYTQATVTRGENMTAPFAALYKKKWLFDIGGWDEDFSLINGGGGYAFDDTDLLTRLRIKGFNQVIDKDIQIIHQWHDRPPIETANGWKKNEELFLAKKLSVDGVEDRNNPLLVANVGREWGKI